MNGPILCWRIAADTSDYRADDRTGRGAEASGGRWNREGTPLLYTSASRALACLETLAHFGRSLPLNRYLVEISVPGELWEARTVFDPDENVGWDAEPAGQVSLDWGSDWARGRGSLIAEVPSVIVPEESNVLINPLASDADRLGIIKVRRWLYDARLRVG